MASSALSLVPGVTINKASTPLRVVTSFSLSPPISAATKVTPFSPFSLSAASGFRTPARISTLSAYLADRAVTVAAPTLPLAPITKTTGFAITLSFTAQMRQYCARQRNALFMYHFLHSV
ncbi:hypothetical protein EMCRGX_G022187 [Ephydatia muelleri]